MLLAYCDGACRVSNPGECAVSFAVFDGNSEVAHGSRYLGPELHTNNFSEFTALLDLLKWAEDNKVKRLSIYCDSQLVTKTVSGEWKVKHEELKPLHALAYALMVRGGHTLEWIRGHSGNPGNERVDFYCNEVLNEKLQRAD